MRIIRNNMTLDIYREPGDPKFRGGEWGSGESRLLYHIKNQIINNQVINWGDFPTNFIKKRMWKDGHLVDSDQLYLRSRKLYRVDEDGDKIYLAIHNAFWAIRSINDDFNKDGECSLYISEITISDEEIGKHSFSQR